MTRSYGHECVCPYSSTPIFAYFWLNSIALIDVAIQDLVLRGGWSVSGKYMGHFCLLPWSSLKPSPITRYEEVGEEEVTFKMISENASKVRQLDWPVLNTGMTSSPVGSMLQVMQQLDEIRRDRKWVYCERGHWVHYERCFDRYSYPLNHKS